MTSAPLLNGKADILIVDDVPTNLDLLSGILRERGYRVRSAINGAFALRSARHTPPDLILLDITMPDLSGYEVCQQLKADETTRQAPVIFISALDDALDKVRAFQVGGADYITKPFQLEEVLARVENQLMVSSLQHQLEQRVGELQAMTASLQGMTATLQALNGRLQHELLIAHNIQESLLPPPHPEWDALDVMCYSESAREVGGDWYSYATCTTPTPTTASPTYSVTVGDVSGKGMPAALLMAVSVTSFRSIIQQQLPPEHFMLQMDRTLCDFTRPSSSNCACVYVHIQPDNTGGYRVRAANAACVAPLVRRADGTVEWLDVGGLPLGTGGMLPVTYTEASTTLLSGDVLLLCSDGVIEAHNETGELFGFDRIEAAAQTCPQHTADTIVAFIRDQVRAFTGDEELRDDMTMVVVRIP